jgi:hypothetical protein
VALRQREERRQADAVATVMRIDSAVLAALASLHRCSWRHWPRCTGRRGSGSRSLFCFARQAVIRWEATDDEHGAGERAQPGSELSGTCVS